ncbi:PDZ domain-containing protein [Hydrogenophaga sp. XSHU_21]
MGKQPIDIVADLPLAIGQARPGERVEIGLWRERHQERVTAELAEATVAHRDKASPALTWGGGARLGLALRPLTPGERTASGLRNGLLIEGVTGPAEMAGVQAGDLLVGINGQPVNTPGEVRDADQHRQASIALQLRRGDAMMFVPVPLG